MTLLPDQWARVKELFEGALALAPSQRSPFVESACGDDDALRRQVEELLASHEQAKSFLETPAVLGDMPSLNLEGQQLGPYLLQSRIAAGGMGEVYKGRDTRLNRTVAIKVRPQRVVDDLGARERFEREARTVATLNHPNICTLHDAGRQDGIDFLVMEFLEGETLAARLERGSLPMTLALQLAVQIVSGLDKAHRAGIVHRDLKPGNIFLVRGGKSSVPPTAKLLDFGLAKATGPVSASGGAPLAATPDLTVPGIIVGTVQYMAPEQIEGKNIDARADLFAFGSVLFEMLSGRKAFEADSNASTMAAILEREPPLLSSVQPLASPALDRLVRTCLAKDPDDRWQTARDLLRELQWVAMGETDAGDTRTTPQSLGRPRLLAALALAGFAAAAGLGYFVGVRGASSTAPAVRVARLTDFLGLEEYPAVSPDGRSVAFTADEGGTRQIWVKLTAGGAPLRVTHDKRDHLRPRWSPDSSSIIYFSPPASGEPSGTLWEVSALGGGPRRLADSVADADVSHDGSRLAFVRSADGRLELVTADRDGANIKVIVRLDAGYSYVSPRWSPDDTVIAYQRNRMSLDDEVFVVPATGGEPRGITQASNRMSGFAWLPDGSAIVVSSSRGSSLYYLPSFNLWTVSLRGGRWRQTTFGEVSYLYPDVDRTGTLVSTRLQLRSDIWRYPVEFAAAENVRLGVPVTRQTGQVRTPTVGPGDKEVAYVSDSGGHANIWVTRLDTGESRQITYERDPEISVGVPVWSPDGRRIAFASSRDAPKGQNGYWLVSPDGSGLRNLRLLAGWADWSADGRWVYYSEDPSRSVVSKVSIDGGQPVLVRKDPSTRPAISRDGSTLYWLVELLAGSGLADYEIRTASPEDGPARTLVRIPGRRVPIWLMMQPVVSPDGKWLAVPLVDNGTTNIWAVSTVDGTLRQLTDFGHRATFIARRLSWASDSRSIFAAVGEGESDVVLLAGVVAGSG
jgi:Tol biopolymer transport system component/tRNA A-37 threonylcarbamoyl transferase component Bud32